MSDFDYTVSEQELHGRYAVFNKVKSLLQDKKRGRDLLPAPPMLSSLLQPNFQPNHLISKTLGKQKSSPEIPTHDDFLVPPPAPIIQDTTSKLDAIKLLNQRREEAEKERKAKEEREAKLASARQAAEARAQSSQQEPSTQPNRQNNPNNSNNNRYDRFQTQDVRQSNIPIEGSSQTIPSYSSTFALSGTPLKSELIISGVPGTLLLDDVKKHVMTILPTGLVSVELCNTEDDLQDTKSYLAIVMSPYFLNKLRNAWHEQDPFESGNTLSVTEKIAIDGTKSGNLYKDSSIDHKRIRSKHRYKDLDNASSTSVFSSKMTLPKLGVPAFQAGNTSGTGVPGLPGLPGLPGALPVLPTLPGHPRLLPALPGSVPTLPGLPGLPGLSGPINTIPSLPGLPSLSSKAVSGLPNLPSISTVPNLPSIPGLPLPGLPGLPGLSTPALPGLPGLSAPGLPGLPGLPTPALSNLAIVKPSKKRKLVSYLDLYDDPEL